MGACAEVVHLYTCQVLCEHVWNKEKRPSLHPDNFYIILQSVRRCLMMAKFPPPENFELSCMEHWPKWAKVSLVLHSDKTWWRRGTDTGVYAALLTGKEAEHVCKTSTGKKDENDQPRICVDLKRLHKAVKYLVPTIDDILPKLAGATFWRRQWFLAYHCQQAESTTWQHS